MLQLLHLDVSKVDRVLHMGYAWEATSGADDVRGGVGPLLVRSLVRARRIDAHLRPLRGSVRTDVRTLASPFFII